MSKPFGRLERGDRPREVTEIDTPENEEEIHWIF